MKRVFFDYSEKNWTLAKLCFGMKGICDKLAKTVCDKKQNESLKTRGKIFQKLGELYIKKLNNEV